MRFWSRTRMASESGQALVEMAVAGSLLAVIFLGVTEFGKVVYSSIEISNAAKAGVQYGAQNSSTASDGTGIQNAAQAAAPDLSGLTASSSTSCICSDGSSSTYKNTDCPNSHLEESVIVKTQVTVTPPVKLPGFPANYTLKGKAVQKCTQ